MVHLRARTHMPFLINLWKGSKAIELKKVTIPFSEYAFFLGLLTRQTVKTC